jgi:hypothetical protein
MVHTTLCFILIFTVNLDIFCVILCFMLLFYIICLHCLNMIPAATRGASSSFYYVWVALYFLFFYDQYHIYSLK